MGQSVNKDSLKQLLITSLDDELNAAIAAAQQAQQAAAHEDNKPENQYDTLSLEAAYLAHGQSERILELQQQRIRLSKWSVPVFNEDDDIATGALLCLHHAQFDPQWLWLTIWGGGRSLQWQQRSVLLLSPQAPLAQQLSGKGVDDEVSWQGHGGWQITELY